MYSAGASGLLLDLLVATAFGNRCTTHASQARRRTKELVVLQECEYSSTHFLETTESLAYCQHSVHFFYLFVLFFAPVPGAVFTR